MRAPACILLLGLLTGACAGTPQKVNLPAVERSWLSFLEDGKTRKEDVLTRLGPPSERFGEGRIVTYQFRVDSKTGIHIVPLNLFAGRYPQLVLVFDRSGILRRHALVDIGRLKKDR